MAKYIECFNAEKAIREYADIKHNNGDITTANCVLKAVSVLKEIPAADVVEVKHGKWEIVDSDLDWVEGKCSACGYTDCFDESGFYKFCPECGAKMGEDKKEKGLTNYDRITSMSLDELADMLQENIHTCDFCIRKDAAECVDAHCKDNIKKWLESEVSE